MDDNTLLELRFDRYGARLKDSLRAVYGERAEDTYERVCRIIEGASEARSPELKRLDEARLLRPDWLQDESMIGYVAYTERFAGTLQKIASRLDHLESLGVTYLHLMPLLQPREGDSDGGYAVQDYRAVRSDLGTMEDLSHLAAQLRGRGISLVVDLVLNHVAREHVWAQRARAGEAKYRDYFYIFDDRSEPDRYERSLPEIFPDFAPGNFTWDEEAQGWVWTTFNSFQWDVNWANPDVFCEYLDIICNLANHGAEVIRLDAIAFILETSRDELPGSARGAPPDGGAACGVADRGTGSRVQSGGHRRAGRTIALSGAGRAFRSGVGHGLPQQPDGAAVEFAREP